MSRVCLVVPTNKFDQYFVQVPLDVTYAAGELRARGHDVTVWDQRRAERPASSRQDVLVLFTAIADRAQCYPLDLTALRQALDEARRICPGAVTIAAGPHGTHLPHATISDLGVDHVVCGEADSAAVQGVADVLAGGAPPVLPAAVRPADLLRSSDSVTEVPPYPNIPVDDLAPAAFDLFPTSQYTSGIVVDGRPTHGPCGMALGARGCTYGCTFCHLPFGTRIRKHPTDRVIEEIDVQKAAGLDHVFFLDYVFGITPPFYDELCSRMTGRGVGFIGQTRAEIVLRTDVRRWADAGCTGMWLGAESPTVAGTGVHKRVTADQIEQAVDKLADAGIVPFAFILMGLPDDEASTTGRLVEWVAGLPAWFGLNQLYLRPGTSLYDERAAALNGGPLPSTWAQVEQVTHTYRDRYPADLDTQEQQLRALPNFLGNALQPA